MQGRSDCPITDVLICAKGLGGMLCPLCRGCYSPIPGPSHEGHFLKIFTNCRPWRKSLWRCICSLLSVAPRALSSLCSLHSGAVLAACFLLESCSVCLRWASALGKQGLRSCPPLRWLCLLRMWASPFPWDLRSLTDCGKFMSLQFVLLLL